VWPVSGTGRPDRSRLSPAAWALVEPLRGEEVVVARRRGLEAANRRRRGKAEEALLEALRRLQARGERCPAIPPFQGLLGALQATVGGLMGEGQTPDPGLGSRATPAAYLSTPGRSLSPPPLLAGFMRGSPGIHRNSMHAGPRFRPFRALPLREGELSRKWGTRASSRPSRTMEA
jgi:hypothetical protein